MTNREFKFRLWNKRDNEWDNPAYMEVFHGDGTLTTLYGLDNYIIQQYTGLQDKNGRDIYEGDILKFYKHGDVHGPEGLWVEDAPVWYSEEDAQFVFGKYKMVNNNEYFNAGDKYWWYSMADDLGYLEVTGNIFENK